MALFTPRWDVSVYATGVPPEPRMTDECEELAARADMLHREADLGRARARALGTSWEGFCDQVDIAVRCEAMAAKVDAKIEETC